MNRSIILLAVVLGVAGFAVAEEKKAPVPPATPQDSADRYFAAIGSDKTPDPAPMMVSKWKMTPDQVAAHARMLAVQLKDKTMKSEIIVAGQKVARVVGSEITHSNGEKCVVFLDLQKEDNGWMISDVNCLVSSQLKGIVQGFKDTKDPKAVVTKAKAPAKGK